MEYKKIVIAGGGVLGSQIAFQSAYCGFDVTILQRKEDNQNDTKTKLDKLKETYLETIKLMAKDKDNWARGIADYDHFDEKKCLTKVEEASKNIKIETDQKEALKDADLVIESITENLKIKNAFYEQIAPLLPEKTVVVTNSSTLLPSKMASSTGRGEKFLSLHFANSIWKNNTAEVMAHPGTADKYFNEIVEFAEAINMIALPVKEEKAGYLLNSMLVPFLLSAIDMLANGPFQIIDTVGLMTAKNIVLEYQKVPGLINPLLKKMMLPYNYKGMLAILNKYIDEGKLGKQTGEGFYKYHD